MSAERKRLVATVRGQVQGVGFRWFVQREAARFDLEGWVANQPDRTVEVVAEGLDGQLDQLLLQLWEGPPGASVDGVDVRYEPARANLVGFTIRSAGHSGD
jgi:acylphosphatase